MWGDLLSLMWMPFLMCLVLTGIHAYLGFHVIAREVVFVDIALAQIAALGATAAFLFGFELETWQSYAAGLAFTILGALVLALTRSRRRLVSHEAVIGVVYAGSAAGAVWFPGAHLAGEWHGSARRGGLGLRHRRECPGHGGLRGPGPADRGHRRLRLRAEPARARGHHCAQAARARGRGPHWSVAGGARRRPGVSRRLLRRPVAAGPGLS